MITKNHYRMYKKGKMWVWGLITFSTTFTVIGAKNVLANADVNNSNNNNNVNNVCSDSNVSNRVQTNQVTLQKQNISNNSVSQQSNFVNKNSENQVSNVNLISSSNFKLNNDSKNINPNVQLNNNDPLVKVNINGSSYIRSENSDNNLTGFQHIDNDGTQKTYYCDPNNGQILYGQQKIDNHWYLFGNDGSMLTGFQYIPDQNKTCYYDPNSGQMLYGLQQINNDWYLFDVNSGAMLTGQQNVDGWRYFDDKTGKEVVDRFQYINGQNKVCYYGDDGIMLYGHHCINNKWYYFDYNTGAILTGWQDDPKNGKTYYLNPSGWSVSGQQKLNNHWYLFGNDGSMLTGFQYIPDQNKTCYYDPTTGQMLYGLQQIKGKTYYFDPNYGSMEKGQQKIDNHWYLFGNDGSMLTGFQYIPDQNKTCYYSLLNGQMQYGLQNINGHWYLFDPNDGSMQCGERYYANGWRYFDQNGQEVINNFVDQNGKRYFYDQNGIKKFGIQYVNDHLRYFDPTTGAEYLNGMYNIDGNDYVFDTNGYLVSSNVNNDGQVKLGGFWYLLDKGFVKTGFQYIPDQNKTCYYNPTTGQMEYGEQKIDGHWYLFDPNYGSKLTGFQYVPGQNKTCYYNQDGQMQYGWQTINGQKYYLNPDIGAVTYGQYKINGYWYLFDQKDGHMLAGFQYIPDQNKTCYYDPNSGQMLYGQQHIDGHWYLFDQNSGSMLTGFQYVPGQNKTCYYDPSNGQMLYGWQQIDGHTYYFDVNTGSMYVGTQTINGKQYHFDSNGEESPIINFRNLYGSHLDFVNSLINGAIQGWNEYGILPSVTIAQAILESGWGQSYLSTAAHNLFGIKGSYNGQSIILPTKEWNGYEYVTINDSFRRYDNNSESVADHGYFLTINSRYNNLHWQRDYHTVCELLQQDGYATAPTYASSLINIIDCYGLNSVDQSLF